MSEIRIPRVVLVLTGLATLGVIDRGAAGGYQLGPLYLVPIVISAYFGGMGEGLFAAAVASGIWLFNGVSNDLILLGPGPFVVNALGRIFTNVFVASVVGQFRMKQQALRQALSTDLLTSLANSRAFSERLRAETAQALQDEGPLAVLIVDCDRFTELSAGHGQKGPDFIAFGVAETVRRHLQPPAFVARIGDGRFGVILHSTDESRARRIAEGLRTVCADLRLRTPDERMISTTVSVGIAAYVHRPHSDALIVADEMHDRAAAAAQTAAQGGGNRVCIG